jgi:hypothetical protein
MVTALAVLFAVFAAIALFDLAAATFGVDSREGFADDLRR